MKFAARLDPVWVRRVAKTPPPWGPLGYFTYKRTYARRIEALGRTEQFHETLERVINALLAVGMRVTQREAEDLFTFCYTLQGLPGGRMLWQLGTPTMERLGGDSACNCFSGDTRFFADGVLRRFDEVVGQTVAVLCADGVTRLARVRNYGTQALTRIVFKVPGKSAVRKTYRATADHRWLLADGSVTSSLAVGDRVTIPAVDVDDTDAEGFAHGLVFGDGTGPYGREKAHTIRLCGAKAAHLDALKSVPQYTGHSVRPGGDPHVRLAVDGDWKALPGDDKSLRYKAAFVRGWLAADGSVRPGQTRLHTTDSDAAKWLLDHSGVLGCTVTGWNETTTATNFGDRTLPLIEMSLRFQDVTVTVESITPDATEDVFCVEEPVTETFTLEGGVPTKNCWYTHIQGTEDFAFAFDRSMLGGGVGFAADGSNLPVVVPASVTHVTEGADFEVPDTREGWVELLRRTYNAYFGAGPSFTYGTRLVRPAGSPIRGFGGVASGPGPLIAGVTKLSALFSRIVGRRPTSVDVVDMQTIQGEIVVSGNVRRTALIGLGAHTDTPFLHAKRWDLGPVPGHRDLVNLTVRCDDARDLPDDYWFGFEKEGEQFGLYNEALIRRTDPLVEGTNPCAEANLEDKEPCDLTETMVSRIKSLDDWITGQRLLYRVAKTVLQLPFLDPKTREVVARNQRIGMGVTGIRGARWTDDEYRAVYAECRAEDRRYSREIGANESIKLTTVKPGGTLPLLPGVDPGVHAGPANSEYYLRRISVATGHPLIEAARAAGYYVESKRDSNQQIDSRTMVVSFPVSGGSVHGGAIEQLRVHRRMQEVWSDQSVSVTVTFRQEEVPAIKAYLAEHYRDTIKTVSFMRDYGHGFTQTPYEPISRDLHRHLSAGVKPILDVHVEKEDYESEVNECVGGTCPSR